MASKVEHELAHSQRDLLELKRNVVLLSEDVDGSARLREKVQVELKGHGSSGTVRLAWFNKQGEAENQSEESPKRQLILWACPRIGTVRRRWHS